MKEKKKNTIIVVTAVMTAVVCIALTFWGNWKNGGVLTTDAFIGVMATFIGVCATLIVGVQIVNHIEIREMRENIKEFEIEKNTLRQQMDAFSINLKQQIEVFSIKMDNTRLYSGNTLVLLARMAQKQNVPDIEFLCWGHSIIIADGDKTDGEALRYRYRRLTELSYSIKSINRTTIKKLYQRLSELEISDKIEHHDEIISLHYKILLEIKKQINETSDNSKE